MKSKLLLSITLLIFTNTIFSQTTEFTYQGSLKVGNPAQPANGNYNFEFRLFNQLTGGTQIGPTLTRNAVEVVNGVFTITLDFGDQFGDASRFLETHVSPGGVPYVILVPRQRIISSPYAIQARNAESVGGFAPGGFIQNNTSQQPFSNFNISGNGIVGGNLGVGTNAPVRKTHVSGPGIVRSRINSDSNAGVELTINDQPGWSVATANGGHFLIFNDAILQNAFWIDKTSNNAGIGTTAPGFKLEVVDSSNAGLRVQTNAAGGNVASFGGNGAFRIDSAGLSGGRFIVAENGNVGIGDSVPINKLTVNGNISLQVASGGTSQLCRNPIVQIAFCSSSMRYKQNVNSFNSGLSLLKQLRPVSFNWKQGGMADLGLVAEEVAEVAPLLATYDDKGEIEGVKYDRLGVVAVNAIKEQQAQIEEQSRQITEQKTINEKLQRQIDLLTKIICRSNPSDEVCKEEK